MITKLHFNGGHYRVTQLIEPNIIEIEGIWFIKLEGVDETTVKKEKLKEFLNIGTLIKVIPYNRTEDAFIVSDVWLKDIHINKQFSNYIETKDLFRRQVG